MFVGCEVPQRRESVSGSSFTCYYRGGLADSVYLTHRRPTSPPRIAHIAHIATHIARIAHIARFARTAIAVKYTLSPPLLLAYTTKRTK